MGGIKFQLFLKVGVGLLSLTAAFIAYTVFKPNINPQSLKEEAERNIENTRNTFQSATNAFK